MKRYKVQVLPETRGYRLLMGYFDYVEDRAEFSVDPILAWEVSIEFDHRNKARNGADAPFRHFSGWVPIVVLSDGPMGVSEDQIVVYLDPVEDVESDKNKQIKAAWEQSQREAFLRRKSKAQEKKAVPTPQQSPTGPMTP